jgi:hypothetical protein
MSGFAAMHELRGWTKFGWIALPTVMYGGYSLMQLVSRNALTPSQVNFFRAGRADAGVLTLMSLLYYAFLSQTSLSPLVKNVGCGVMVGGVMAQSGGFFIKLSAARMQLGTTVTSAGAILLTCAIAILVYGLSI